MSAQHYSSPKALGRMAQGNCPECGYPPDRHDGWGGPMGCTLTDNGAAARIEQFRADAGSAQGGTS